MRTTIATAPKAAMATALLAAWLAASPLGGVSAAAAESARETFDARERVVSDFCHAYPGASSCDDWQHNRAGWDKARYLGFYRQHRYEYGMNTTEAAAAFGVIAGTMTPSGKAEVIGGTSNHVYDCRATYGSYDRQTDSYLSYDGTRQKCEL